MLKLNPPSRQPIRRILLDLSHTHNSHHNTGIQRVVRSLHRELPIVARRKRMEYVAVVCKDKGFVRMDSLVEDSRIARFNQLQHDVVSHLPKLYRTTFNLICKCLPIKQLRRWFLPEPGHQGLFKLPLKLIAKFMSPDSSSAAQVQMGASDLLIMPDGYWAMMHVWDAVAAVRKNNTHVAVIIHDMICITHPQYFGPFAKENFSAYLRAVARYASMVVATTQTGKKQLDVELPAFVSEGEKVPPITSFRLGADVSEASGKVRAELLSAFSQPNRSVYLMVSTFEPRKNHPYVLDTFESLWRSNPECTLVFVGAVGWMSEACLERIQKHPSLNQQLFVFHDLSDAEVNFCYKQSKAVIFPSVVEGFGLPIVEALWHGKKTFVSDTPIHREVGRTDCEYFDLANTDSLRKRIIQHESSPRQSVAKQRRPTVDWQASTQDLLRQILNEIAASSDTCQRLAS